MSIPPLRKWRPGMDLYRLKGQGWQFFIWPHKDNNPIITPLSDCWGPGGRCQTFVGLYRPSMTVGRPG